MASPLVEARAPWGLLWKAGCIAQPWSRSGLIQARGLQHVHLHVVHGSARPSHGQVLGEPGHCQVLVPIAARVGESSILTDYSTYYHSLSH